MSDTTTCSNCQAPLSGAAAFCTSCGTPVATVADPPAPSAPPTAPPAPPTPAPPDDATRIDNPGLHDATTVYESPAEPWQPADAPSPPPPVAPATPPGAPTWAPPAPPAPPPAPAWQQAPPSTGSQWGVPESTPDASASTRTGSTFGGLLALLGGAITLVGLFTDWIGNNQDSAKISGWDLTSGDLILKSDDPYIILGLGIGALVLGVLLFTGTARWLVRLATLVVGVAIAGTVARDWMSIEDVVKGFRADVKITAEFGFYLTIAGGVVTALAALMPRRKASA